VSGQELDQAEATLQADGIGYKVFGGGALGVVIASDWTVCSQKPSAGTKANSLDLVVARSCSTPATPAPATTAPAAAATTAEAATTTAASAATTTEGATPQSAPPGAASAVPNVSGQELDQAEATLQSDGLGYNVLGGGVFGVVIASDWTVCSQKPPAGTKATSVDLVVARSCS
jgi:beta-lactam-binding protein with PASTA domain